MLLKIGPTLKPQGLVGLLLDCHQRIRTFVHMAGAIGARSDLPADEIIELCMRCERYFTLGLPLHVQDEELSLMPRFLGVNKEVDDAFSLMEVQHRVHEPLLDSLIERLQAVRTTPSNGAHRESLEACAVRLADVYEAHLSLEEMVVFPAIQESMTRDAQASVIGELRARRQVVAGQSALPGHQER